MFKTTFWALIAIYCLKLIFGLLVIYTPVNSIIFYTIDMFLVFYFYLDIYFMLYYWTFDLGIYYGYYWIIEPLLILAGFYLMCTSILI
jgi:hypothetical protein